MATIQHKLNKDVVRGEQVVVATWPTLTNSGADVGAALCLADYGDKTFQVFGTLGAAGAVAIEGSNDGVNWCAISNRQGTAMSFTALSMNTSQDRPAFVRPRITAGDGTTSLTVTCAAHRSDLGVIG